MQRFVTCGNSCGIQRTTVTLQVCSNEKVGSSSSRIVLLNHNFSHNFYCTSEFEKRLPNVLFILSSLQWYFQVYDSAWSLYALYLASISFIFSSRQTSIMCCCDVSVFIKRNRRAFDVNVPIWTNQKIDTYWTDITNLVFWISPPWPPKISWIVWAWFRWWNVKETTMWTVVLFNALKFKSYKRHGTIWQLTFSASKCVLMSPDLGLNQCEMSWPATASMGAIKSLSKFDFTKSVKS